ncbi:hypothetical protein TEA_013404 [Camellia sinensis var. sinensis]|uniref:Non-haem dioxygenase N-terminal domain-containing protein n=1 Tax=Camellia sinensis var. sinensis TaxID=542762 RepID=A0A4S4D6T5_CAMSN|nr:hypothetical protein TEA_013404 [Camellia sinensis var. sinensis]
MEEEKALVPDASSGHWAFRESAEDENPYTPPPEDQSPKNFHSTTPDNLNKTTNPSNTQFSFPIIDLTIIDKDPIRRKVVIDEICEAAENWGFFQVVNHGIPESVLEEMKKGVHRFYEQDSEMRKEWYTRDVKKAVVYNCNFDLFSAPAANWRDTFYCSMTPKPPNPEELPPPCSLHLLTETLHPLKLEIKHHRYKRRRESDILNSTHTTL